MFTHLIPCNNILYSIILSDYAEKHFLKDFKKDTPSKPWAITCDSIREDLSRIEVPSSDTQKIMQVNELWHKDSYWIFKYEFSIAGSKTSHKAASNRIIAFLDSNKKTITIMMVYKKTYLPKNMNETSYIETTVKDNFPDFWKACH